MRDPVNPKTSARSALPIKESEVTQSAASNSRDAFAGVGFARRGHLLQHERMAADRALSEDDQAARQDVRAFDGDRNRHLHVGGAEEIRRPHADALAADDVHPSLTTCRARSVM